MMIWGVLLVNAFSWFISVELFCKVSLIVQLVENCASITKITGSSPVQIWIFSRSFSSFLSWVHNYDSTSFINSFICNLNVQTWENVWIPLSNFFFFFSAQWCENEPWDWRAVWLWEKEAWWGGFNVVNSRFENNWLRNCLRHTSSSWRQHLPSHEVVGLLVSP